MEQAGRSPQNIVVLSKLLVDGMGHVRQIPGICLRLQNARGEYRAAHEWVHADDREISMELVCEALDVGHEAFQAEFLRALPENDRRIALGILPWECPLCLQMKR